MNLPRALCVEDVTAPDIVGAPRTPRPLDVPASTVDSTPPPALQRSRAGAPVPASFAEGGGAALPTSAPEALPHGVERLRAWFVDAAEEAAREALGKARLAHISDDAFGRARKHWRNVDPLISAARHCLSVLEQSPVRLASLQRQWQQVALPSALQAVLQISDVRSGPGLVAWSRVRKIERARALKASLEQSCQAARQLQELLQALALDHDTALGEAQLIYDATGLLDSARLLDTQPEFVRDDLRHVRRLLQLSRAQGLAAQQLMRDTGIRVQTELQEAETFLALALPARLAQLEAQR